MPVQVGDICKNGHEIIGSNIQKYMSRGRENVRCATCNQPPKQVARKPGDTCKHGHLMEGENLGIRKNNAGNQVFFCKSCRKDQLQRWSRTPAGRVANSKSNSNPEKKRRAQQRRQAERADELILKGKEENALNYLRLNKRSERAAESLQNAMDANDPNCAGNPGPYIDYDEEYPPTKQEAYIMCNGCPMLIECARFANTYRPEIGVWGGEVYKGGLPLYN